MILKAGDNYVISLLLHVDDSEILLLEHNSNIYNE